VGKVQGFFMLRVGDTGNDYWAITAGQVWCKKHSDRQELKYQGSSKEHEKEQKKRREELFQHIINLQ
jgi:hypothetical protein